MTWDNVCSSNGNEVSNLFASFFKSIYKTPPGLSPDPTADPEEDRERADAPDAHLTEFEVRFDDVYRQLCLLNVNKDAGPDGLPNLFLRKCAIGLCEPITNMIQSSLAKLLEKIILPQLNFAFKNIIVSRQHGVFGGRSTTTNLYGYVNYILNSMGRGKEVHAKYTDFSKAFDMVNHQILLKKLSTYGVKYEALEWLFSYLFNRKLRVRVNVHPSNECGVTSDVPQGSHLGLILCSIFINDISDNIRSEYRLYADDMKVYRV
ncbi:uncharacterized protein LOC130667334 [Microplitis mediator]|uniref:uncharacterized protein LOC130667334 n=1 Tax=Microplitis mediator TaxID=375433 RepID=UPI0025545855|nr:uncharacterized protein LOC130667334 [Microplitis mediator]